MAVIAYLMETATKTLLWRTALLSSWRGLYGSIRKLLITTWHCAGKSTAASTPDDDTDNFSCEIHKSS